MTKIPRYLQRAREASQQASMDRQTVPERERSEKSEKRRFECGRRYRIDGPVVGIIHRTDSAFDQWREGMRLPRAGVMTIQGERVIVADVRAALRTGYVDVVGILQEGFE